MPNVSNLTQPSPKKKRTNPTLRRASLHALLLDHRSGVGRKKNNARSMGDARVPCCLGRFCEESQGRFFGEIKEIVH